jgi:hypothetical protein
LDEIKDFCLQGGRQLLNTLLNFVRDRHGSTSLG